MGLGAIFLKLIMVPLTVVDSRFGEPSSQKGNQTTESDEPRRVSALHSRSTGGATFFVQCDGDVSKSITAAEDGRRTEKTRKERILPRMYG